MLEIYIGRTLAASLLDWQVQFELFYMFAIAGQVDRLPIQRCL